MSHHQALLSNKNTYRNSEIMYLRFAAKAPTSSSFVLYTMDQFDFWPKLTLPGAILLVASALE